MSSINTRSSTLFQLAQDNNFILKFTIGSRRFESLIREINHRTIKAIFPSIVPLELDPNSVIQDAVLHSVKHQRDTTLALKVRNHTPRPHGGLFIEFEPHNEKTSAQLWKLLIDIRGGDLTQGRNRIKSDERPIKIPARGIYTEQARLERLRFARKYSRSALASLTSTELDAQGLTGNIENLVGSVEVPVGLAGPLQFWGESVTGQIFAPLATTEGALVASATRGATAITRAGGVATRVIQQRMMRVPMFVMSDMQAAALFERWVQDHVPEIREQIGQVSRHAKLVSVEPRMLGNMVHVAFVYETGDAAGQNMTTTCTWQACQWMMQQMIHHEQIRFENFIIEANMSGDKKVNYNSFISGRGTRVLAEAFLDEDVLQNVLKVTSEQLLRAHHGFVAGSIQVGMIGYNINVANIVGALFTACGQDIACVHESSVAQLHLEAVDGGVYASMLMPSLIVGTVGGGTHLSNQKDYLDLMGCAGSGQAGRLAEIISGFCLALDLSTLSAIASGQFASAHEKLGRNRPVEWLRKDELTADFFQPGLRAAFEDDDLDLIEARPIKSFKMGSSIITELTARKVNKLVGHFPYALRYRRNSGPIEHVDVIAKVKPLDQEVILMVNSMAAMCGGSLAALHNRFKHDLGFAGCHRRELAIYRQTDLRFTQHVPRVFGVHEDPRREAYVVVLELLKDVRLINTENDVSGWRRPEIETVIRGLADLHAVWYGQEEALMAQPWIGPVMTAEKMVSMTGLWEALEVHAAEEFPDMMPRRILQYYLSFVRSIETWWPVMERMPRTLIHNDFNPRNIALRPGDGGDRLVAYDWELATIGLPQHDLAEFLLFVLGPDVDSDELKYFVELHRTCLEASAGVQIDAADWYEGYRLSFMDLAVNRLAMYTMAHTFRHYGFMERVCDTAKRIAFQEFRLDQGPFRP
ncbi:MAG: phosphotransferase [Myxococcota bacterium]|nr:phosphotransferase [Myxococcota bacterium]